MPRQQKKNYSHKKYKHGRDQRKGHKKSNSDKSKFNSSKANKFKHIQRNKESQDVLRKQIAIEGVYRKKRNIDEIDSQPEEDTFDQLLSSFKGKRDTKLSAIESTDDECENDEELSENDEEFSENDEEQSEDISDEKEDIDIAPQNSEYSNTDSEESADSDVDDNTDKMDPFCIHLDHDLSPELLNAVTTKPQNSIRHDLKTDILGRLEINIPSDKNNYNPSKIKNKKMILDEEQQYAQLGSIPKILNIHNLDLRDHHVKLQIYKNIGSANKNNLEDPNDHLLTKFQVELFSLMNNYQDVYFPNRNIGNGEQVRFVYCLHALNHVLKTRLKIIHHNSRLGKLKYQNGVGVPDHCRDQGLVRPKVLIILPFRDSAYRVINTLISLLVPDLGAGVINHKKFVDEFSGNSIIFPVKNPKPEDYETTFSGNTDDTFRIGLSLTKKCIKLYTEFSKSDIIISSPLGLRMIIGAPGEKDRDYDFLSSIELLIMDQTEIFLAQNWDHLLHILNHVHLQPQTVETDLSRVRTWSINGLSKFYCQTILLASHELPEFRALFNHRCLNYRGQIRVANPIINGSIKNVVIQLPQIFHRINSSSLGSSFDTRFNYFINSVLPQYKNPSMAHCLIYVPSYFDYVRIRNYMKRETINFVQICEYSKDEKIARARDMFFHSSAHFLVYSERAHFYRRTRIKGIRHLIFYQPPNWPNFYSEMINLMHEMNQNKSDGASDSMTVTVLYTKYDILQISEIVGNEKTSKMMNSDKTTHMFMTGN